jgi:hypothetical protein
MRTDGAQSGLPKPDRVRDAAGEEARLLLSETLLFLDNNRPHSLGPFFAPILGLSDTLAPLAASVVPPRKMESQ